MQRQNVFLGSKAGAEGAVEGQRLDQWPPFEILGEEAGALLVMDAG
jgi:hypothetical protein